MTKISKPVKSQDKTTEKGFDRLTHEIEDREPSIRRETKALTREDLKDDEFAIAKVSALSESPTSPSSDKLRLYYRNDGKLFKLEFTEV